MKNTPESDLIAAQAGDREVIGRLLTRHHEGLLRRICVQFGNWGISHDDLFQKACIVGMNAIRWFDPSRGWKFNTYLGACIARKFTVLIKQRRFERFPQSPNETQDDIFQQTPEPDKSDVEEFLEGLTSEQHWIITFRG